MRAALLCLLALTACQPASPAAAPSRSPSPTPQVAVRSPDEAMPEDAQVALPRTASRDHLRYEEAARDEPDEVVALAAFQAAGWADASRRSWSGQTLTALVVQADRDAGARRLYDYFAAEAARDPLVASDCQASTALESCRIGTGAGRSVATGVLGTDCFRLEGDPATVARLLPILAGRLRAG